MICIIIYCIKIGGNVKTVHFIGLFFCLFNGIVILFRMFSGSRYLMCMIIESIYDMKDFLIIVMFFITWISIILYKLNEMGDEEVVESNEFKYIFEEVYLLMLGYGSWEVETDLGFFIYYISTVILIILLLNLLISILGDTFDRV